MWRYTDVSRSEFEERKDLVEKTMLDLGCEVTEITQPYEQRSVGAGFEEAFISKRRIYGFGGGFYRISEVLFAEKPFIVPEYADTEEAVIRNAMEDLDPFPYDLSDCDIVREVKYFLGIEPYQHNNQNN